MHSKNFTASSRGISAARDRLVLLRELGHALLDRGEILGRERTLVREVVVEAVLDHRADRHLRVREKLLDRVGEQVRRRVADDVEALGILVGDDRECGVAIDRYDVSTTLAVDLAGERGLGEAGADRGGDFGTETGVSNWRTAPSGSVMETILGDSQKTKSADACRTFIENRSTGVRNRCG